MKKRAIKELIRKEIDNDKAYLLSLNKFPGRIVPEDKGSIEVVRYIQTQPVIDKIKAEINFIENQDHSTYYSGKGKIIAFKRVLEWLS